MSDLGPAGFAAETFAFKAGDVLLLYTDGVVEARDQAGVFYPMEERLAACGWTKAPRSCCGD